MSSFDNDNVSESKKQEQKVKENQEKSTEITTDITVIVNNQIANIATITNDDVKNNFNETYNENTKIINENKCEQLEKNITIVSAAEAENIIATVNNFGYNESINNDTLAAVERNKSNDGEDVPTSLDNYRCFNKIEENNLLTAQKNTIVTVAESSAATCCEINMKRADAEQQVHKQKQKSFSDKQQTTINFATIKSDNETSHPTEVLTSSLLLTDEKDTPPVQRPEKSECNVKITSSNMVPEAVIATKTSALTLLPSSSLLPGANLPHIHSEPTFGVELRNRNSENQQHNTNNSNTYNSTKSESATNLSCAIKTGKLSASASPNMVRNTSSSSVLLPRRVSFPKSDNQLVTGYLEPANPWEHVYMVKSISEIAELYITSCQKHNTKPLQSILDHLKAVDLTKQLRRQPLLSLKSIKLAPSDCEALEEVLKRVQYKAIDLSNCKLEETAASALFDMIEYYEAANELDISSNSMGMTHRGWTSCIYMISHSQELQALNAEGNPISKLSADNLGSALSTSNLHTLKLEHCGLKGAPLSGLCFKLWQNKVLKELWLAYNDLDCNDADTIAEMLKCNHYLELIDISNNNIRDEGLRHIVKALIMQSKELERRTTFQRTAAIDDDADCESLVETSVPVHLDVKTDDASWKTKEQEVRETQSLQSISQCNDLCSGISSCKDSSNLPSIEEKAKEAEVETAVEYEHHKVKPPLISSVGSTIDENDGDEDTDDTVRSSTIKHPLQSAIVGQSMLDKLLSMNSESSSEDGASNLSTDTLAACNSEEASLVSDEIFESAITTTTTTTTSTNTKAPTNAGLDTFSLSADGKTVTSAIVKPPTTTTLVSSDIQREGKEDANIYKSSPLDLKILDRNKIKLGESDVLLVSSPSNNVKSPCIQSTHVIDNTHININNNNNNNNNNPAIKTFNTPQSVTQTFSVGGFSNPNQDQNLARLDVFEVTADDNDCLLSSGVSRVEVNEDVEMRSSEHANIVQHHCSSRALDVNKNSKLADDFDDTHSTDSAFESASEGDISRHLPEEFTRLSTSLESSRFDDIAKELAIETATIASESNECLIAAAAQVTPSSTPIPPTPPFSNLSTPLTEKERMPAESLNSCLSSSLPTVSNTTPSVVKVGFTGLEQPTESLTANANEIRDKMPKVTIAQDSFTQKYKTNSVICTSPSPTPTPPPPSTSPGGASSSLRRIETSCGFLTQSSRICSQSTDSLCSDNSLDGSLGSGDLNFSTSSHMNDKITKNDTLTRQQRPTETNTEFGIRTPGGLKALAVWNNNLTKDSGYYVSDLLAETLSLELINIGKNCLSNEFVNTMKDALTKNTTLTMLGLQSAHLSAKGIETLSSILTFGGNSTLQRIDIRDNKLEVDSLTKIAEVLKSNTTVTQIDIDDEPKRLSIGSEAHLDYARILENVRSMCSRNEKSQAQMQQEKSAASIINKKRGGYYLGSRKISLTCQSRPLVDTTKNVVLATHSKLDIKRKASTRLRSPVPSPTAISPSSSPNRASRFQVFRVSETSPLTSPSTYKPIGSNLVAAKAVSISSAALPLASAAENEGNDSIYSSLTSTSLPTSCSLPSMATISSSTQSIKRLSVSPRSRFLVRKVYEDPNLPLTSQSITPPINPPPTPISRNSQNSTTRSLDISKPEESSHLRQDSLSKSCRTNGSAQETNSTTNATLPTIITPQQYVNTTTDNASTATLSISEDSSAATTTTQDENDKSIPSSKTIITKQCEQSTNKTVINDSNITNRTEMTTTTNTDSPTTTITVPKSSNNLQPSSSVLSTLSSSSDSTSSSSFSSSSSSSTSPASNTDSSEPSSSSPACPIHSYGTLSENQQQQHNLTVSGHCPTPIYNDNDITLTKNTVNEVFGPVAAAAKENFVETSNETIVQQPENQQQRVRKISWISNPTAVDKLLTLFHNSTNIFQRSSSPETKLIGTSTTTTADIQFSQSAPSYAEAAAAAVLPTQQPKSQSSLVPLRKQSPPSWTKLGNDIMTAAATNNVDMANTVATTAAAVVTEQSRSFFDAASKQFRDLSKQVFRQNLSFGNEPIATSSTSNSTIMATVSAPNVQPSASENAERAREHCCKCGFVVDTPAVCLCDINLTNMEYNVDCLPTEIKQEVKENISPEHTINKETLHTMQKIYGSGAPLSSAVTTTITPSINLNTNLDNNDYLVAKDTSTTTTGMFSTELVEATAVSTSTSKSTTPPSTPTTQIHQQQASVTDKSGIESEFLAHYI